MYQHVHLGPSRRADRDNIDRSCSQTQINDVTLEKTGAERQMYNKWEGGKKKRWNLSKKSSWRGRGEVWVHRSGAWAKAVLILLALSVTASEDTAGLWCMAASSSAAVARDTSQGVRHYRDLTLRCWYSRARAAPWDPYITIPLRVAVNIHLLVDLWEHHFALSWINLRRSLPDNWQHKLVINK